MDVTDLVVAHPPQPLAKWLDERRYLPMGAPLIKRVVGLPGQKICRDGLDVSVDGIVMAQAREREPNERASARRRLPEYRCSSA